MWEWVRQRAYIKNGFIKEPLAEFVGTTVFTMFCVGSAAQHFLAQYMGKTESAIVPVFGTVFGLMFSINLVGGISGGHVNPAVTMGLAVAGKLKLAKVPLYFGAQLIGAFFGAFMSYGLYEEKLIQALGSKSNLTSNSAAAGIFAPAPSGTSLGTGFATEVMITAFLIMGILSFVDKLNMKVPMHLLAFYVALLVSGIVFAFSVISGALLNPAKDLGCRLAAFTLGWDSTHAFLNVNSENELQHWWTVGTFGPLIGGALGGFLYLFCCAAHMNEPEPEDEVDRMTSGVRPLLRHHNK